MNNPLVTIIIPTFNRTEFLMNRSLPAALAQTYKNTEIFVIGDGTEQATVDAMETITDPRVFFINLPRSTYPEDHHSFWQVGGVIPLNWGIDHARGDWLCMSGDDDAMLPNFVELLLNEAIAQDVDYIYGRVQVMSEFSSHGYLGKWPPMMGQMSNGLWKKSLNYRYDPESWKKNLPCDWELITRMLDDGVKFGYIHQVVYQYYPAVFRASIAAITSGLGLTAD